MMRIKLLILILCFNFIIYGFDSKEIKTLYDNGKYNTVLEKSLNILTLQKDKLTNKELEEIYFYIALSYKNLNNEQMEISYLKKIENISKGSDILKNVYKEFIRIYKNDYYKREAYHQKIFKEFPKTKDAVFSGYELAKENLKYNSYKKSLEFLEPIVKLWKMGDLIPEIYILCYVAYSGVKDYIEAIDYLRMAEKKAKALIKKNSIYLYEAGKISYFNLNYKRAVLYLSQLVNVYPDFKNVGEAGIILAKSYEKLNNNYMASVYLVNILKNNKVVLKLSVKYTIMLNLGRILQKLSKNELKNIKTLHPLFTDSEYLLKNVYKGSKNFDERREATILLSQKYKDLRDYEKLIDNYYKFLNKSRDEYVEKLFKKNVNLFVESMIRKKRFEKIFEFWVKLKLRKSYFSGENLMKLGTSLINIGMYKNAKEIFEHILKYNMYAKFHEKSRYYLLRIYNYQQDYTHLKYLIDKYYNNNNDDEIKYYLLNIYKNEKSDKLKKFLLDYNVNKINNKYAYFILKEKVIYLINIKKYKDSIEILKKMLNSTFLQKSDKNLLLSWLADSYYLIGKFDKALNYYNMLEKDKYNIEWILFQKYNIFKRLKDKIGMENSLNKLKTLNSDSFWLKQLKND